MASDEQTPESGTEQPEGGAPQYSPDELEAGAAGNANAGADVNLDLVLDIPVDVSLRVGSTDISIRDLVSLVEGSVIALDQDAGEPMDVLVNGTLIAHGEIVVVDDQYGVRLTDVVSPVERIEQLN
ncbi:MAG: flagellar motor switch protein FliN [Woeseiaceae bacterium]|nr:flagellar motor switch protein FliN [Woeseiaceae bacterium]